MTRPSVQPTILLLLTQQCHYHYHYHYHYRVIIQYTPIYTYFSFNKHLIKEKLYNLEFSYRLCCHFMLLT